MSQTFAGLGIRFLLSPLTLLWSVINQTQSNRDSSVEQPCGKTGLAMGLLREACLNGYRGRFYNAQVLLDELYASLADRTTTRLLAQMSRMRPLVIDELGYLTLKPEQANAFFRLMDQRYNRVSTIITTNLDLPDWYELFDKKSLVDALLDRRQHHCITIRIDGPSLRSPEPGSTEPPPASSASPPRRAAKANTR
jgi:DNA replication protein DnaC